MSKLRPTLYEFERNADLTTVGFVEHPRVPHVWRLS